MKAIRAALVLGAAVALTACSATMPDDLAYRPTGDRDVATRAETGEQALIGATPATDAVVPLSRDYHVVDVEVIVPDTLTASEANSYKPRADIVWREDPLGDRHQQVDALITEAVTKGVSGLKGARDVRIELVVTRFHALTEKTRYSLPYGFRATHDIQLTLAVYDAKSGEQIEAPHPVGFEIEAHTNGLALADEARGISQRSRISEALIQMVHRELAAPQA